MSKPPLQELSNPIARQIAEGKPPGEVVEQLVVRGWRIDIAQHYIGDLMRKYDLDHAEDNRLKSVLRTLAARALLTVALVIVTGAIGAIGLALPSSPLGLILFAVAVIALSLGMVFILLT